MSTELSYIYRCGDESKWRTCMCCKKKLQDGDEVVAHPNNAYCLRHVGCIPKSKPRAVRDDRRFDRGRVIKKTGGL